MELNGFIIESREMLKENFLPFQGIWENVKNGLYQDCLRVSFRTDELVTEILSVAQWVFSGKSATAPERHFQERYQEFMGNNRELTKELENAAINEKQKEILYLCILMHIHAGHGSVSAETVEYIHKLLEEKKVVVGQISSSGEIEIYRQKFGIIDGEVYSFDQSGRIVSLHNGTLLSMAQDMHGLCSFAYSDILGLIAVDQDGQVHIRSGQSYIEIPSKAKIVSVSAYLSNYMMLDDKGSVYTNINMDLSNWTDLRYIYVGLNSAAGVKRWSGNIVASGVGDIEPLSNVAKVFTYHGRERHYIALFVNGEAKDDEGNTYRDVTAVALDEDGYYYAAKDGNIYKRPYGPYEKQQELYKATDVEELLIDRGEVFIIME